MFSKKIWVMAITRSRIAVARVNPKSKKVVKSLMYDWTPGELSATFQNIIRDIKTENLRILIADDLSFFLGVNLPDELVGETEYEYLKTQLEQEHETILVDDLWDYIYAGKKGENRKVIVFAPEKELLIDLNNALESHEVLVDFIEPELISKTRHENPIIGLALKDDTKISTDTLNVEIKNDKQEKYEKISGKKPSLIKVFKLGLTILLAIVSVGSAYYYFQINGKKTQEDDVPANSEFTPTPTAEFDPTEAAGLVVVAPTERDVDKADLTISVLNGSGVSGEAAYVKELLLQESFVNIQTGNADNQNYEITSVIFKNDISQESRDVVGDALSQDYDIDMQRIEASGQETDVVIIVGQRKSE